MKTPEEIKKGLECCIKGDCGDCPYYKRMLDCGDVMKEDAVALIQRLEDHIREVTKLVPKWISVEERLPETDESVLIYMVNPNGEHVTTTAELESNKYRRGRNEWNIPAKYYGYDYQITHWMPMPEAPKEV